MACMERKGPQVSTLAIGQLDLQFIEIWGADSIPTCQKWFGRAYEIFFEMESKYDV